MATYEHTTKAQFRTKVRNKLGKNSSAFWPDSEIDQSLEESLLTFGALSGFWKEEVGVLTIENKRIYNLHDDNDVISNKEAILPSYTVQTIVDWLNKDLIESLSEVNPNTEFMDLAAWLKIIETKYNSFQLESGLIVSRISLEVNADQRSIVLPDELIDVLRVTFKFSEDDLFKENKLYEADEEQLASNEDWVFVVNSIPNYYANLYGSTNEMKLFPAPSNHGVVDILFISGSKRNLTVEDLLLLPNNLIPYLKYGVEAEIFALSGPLNDPARSAYAQQRWNEGIQIAKNYTSVLSAKANERPIFLDYLESLDAHFSLEKKRVPPSVLGFVGYNIFVTDIVPSREIANLNLIVNANAKIPVEDEDFILIDLEYVDMLADYVVHLLMIKAGVAEIAATDNLKNKFLQISLAHNERLRMRGVTFETLTGITKRQEKSTPRLVEQNG